jgi:hypothetical protein
VLVFASVQQRLDGLALFDFREPTPSLFDHELLLDVVFGETESRDRSAGFFFCFPLQSFRRIGKQSKEKASADCHHVL